MKKRTFNFGKGLIALILICNFNNYSKAQDAGVAQASVYPNDRYGTAIFILKANTNSYQGGDFLDAADWIGNLYWKNTAQPQYGIGFYTGAAGTLPGGVAPSYLRMAIREGGNVGIGYDDISKITEKFMVVGKTVVQSIDPNATWDNLTTYVDGYSSYIQSNGDEQGMKISSNTGNEISVGDKDDNVILGNNAPSMRMAITAGGNVGIGYSDITKITQKFMVAGKTVVQNYAVPAATWDNLTTFADGTSSYIQSNGDEDGMKISSNTGNKIFVGDDNDNVIIGKYDPYVRMAIRAGGNVGIGYNDITRITERFMVAGKTVVQSVNPDATWDNLTIFADDSSSYLQSNGDEHGMKISSNAGNKIFVGDDNDDVIIGNIQNIKTPLQERFDLFVHKGVLTEDIGIGAKETWSDYVFNKDYELKPLAEVERYIHEHKHLPNIPSQDEVKEEGYTMHDLNVRFLEKIEELTLYSIQQQKTIDQLTKRIEKLESVANETKK